jgi:hypothetical protein
MSKETKYYTLILNYGVEGDEWVDVYGSYSRSEVVDVWEEGFKGYTHEYYGDVWREKHMLIVPTDGSPEALRAVLESLCAPSTLSSEVKKEAIEAVEKKAAVDAMANSLEAQAVRMDNDGNGNPRYYLSAYFFQDAEGNFIRPVYANKYLGKKYGRGWVFKSFALKNDLRQSIDWTNGLQIFPNERMDRIAQGIVQIEEVQS